MPKVPTSREIRDPEGMLMGRIVTSNGVQEARDATGALKATYDPKHNETRDKDGKKLGKGNLLYDLLSKSA
jgi:hypothetical protein